jgi:hypothetical protein
MHHDMRNDLRGFDSTLGKIRQKEFGPEEKEMLYMIWEERDHEQVRDYDYHFTIYLEGIKPGCLLKSSSNVPFDYKWPDFKESVIRMPKGDLADMILICTLFPAISLIPPIEEIISKFSSILKNRNEWGYLFPETYGKLVYSHQLEQLYCMLSGESRSEGAAFRKDWNLKKATARLKSDQLEFKSNVTLRSYIEKHSLSLCGFVFTANYQGGWLLWKQISHFDGDSE